MTSPSPPHAILIVEDEALLAMDIEFMLEDFGHRVVGQAASLYDVEAFPDDLRFNLALVDIQLARGTSGLDVSQMIQRRWPGSVIIFVTANPKIIPADYAGAHGVISKPFSHTGLESAMKYIEQGMCSPPPTARLPGSFVAAPNFTASWS